MGETKNVPIIKRGIKLITILILLIIILSASARSNIATGASSSSYIFNDGFENNNFNTWTSNNFDVSAGGSLIISTTAAHTGTYGAVAFVPAGGSVDTYERITSSSTIYAKAYFKMSAMPVSGAGATLQLLEIESDENNKAKAEILLKNGDLYWGIANKKTTYSYYFETTASKPQVNTWYCVELLRDVANQKLDLWIDGVMKLEVSGLSLLGNNTLVSMGAYTADFASPTGITVYYDDCVISTTYISSNPAWTDGFELPETTSFQQWSAIYKDIGSTVTLSNAHAFAGTYSLHSAATTNLGAAYVQLNIVNTNSIYAGAYVYFTSFGNPNTFTRVLKVTGNAQENSVACVAVVNDNGIMKWGLHWRDGANVLHYEASDWIVQPNTWYFVEVKGVVSSTVGEARLYVNGVEKITKTGLDNHQIGNIYEIRCGLQSDLSSGIVDAYFDNVIVNTSYIIGNVADPQPPAPPQLFSDSFENANLNAWTGQYQINGAIAISNTYTNSGAYSVRVTTTGITTKHAYTYKTLAASNIPLYAKTSFKMDKTPPNNLDDVSFIWIENKAIQSPVVIAALANYAGVLTWELDVYDYTWHTWTAPVTNFQTNAWYSVQIEANTLDCKMYINGNLIISETTNIPATPYQYIATGACTVHGIWTPTIYVDDVTVCSNNS